MAYIQNPLKVSTETVRVEPNIYDPKTVVIRTGTDAGKVVRKD